MWEIYSNGVTPYKNIVNVVEYLIQGKRLSKPNDCEDDMYELMLKCWNEDSKQRPKWPEIFKSISKTSAEELFASAEKLILQSKDNNSIPSNARALLEQAADLNYPPALVALHQLSTADLYEDWFEKEICPSTIQSWILLREWLWSTSRQDDCCILVSSSCSSGTPQCAIQSRTQFFEWLWST